MERLLASRWAICSVTKLVVGQSITYLPQHALITGCSPVSVRSCHLTKQQRLQVSQFNLHNQPRIMRPCGEHFSVC